MPANLAKRASSKGRRIAKVGARGSVHPQFFKSRIAEQYMPHRQFQATDLLGLHSYYLSLAANSYQCRCQIVAARLLLRFHHALVTGLDSRTTEIVAPIK